MGAEQGAWVLVTPAQPLGRAGLRAELPVPTGYNMASFPSDGLPGPLGGTVPTLQPPHGHLLTGAESRRSPGPQRGPDTPRCWQLVGPEGPTESQGCGDPAVTPTPTMGTVDAGEHFWKVPGKCLTRV